MAKREALMLAHHYDENKYGIAGWFASEKLDGMRCFWDGGISRGFYCDQVPFANTEKDGRYIARPKATGLWSRAFKPIMAPDYFLNRLPSIPLDGELYLERGRFQELMSIVKDLQPGPGWKKVTFQVFDSPSLKTVFADGEIKSLNFKKHLYFNKIRDALRFDLVSDTEFEHVYNMLRKNYPENECFKILEQYQLPYSTADAKNELQERLDLIVDGGGEGLILRQPMSVWRPERCHSILKVKKPFDDEGIVTGYVSGRQTDLGSKLLGLMGALILDYKGQRLELSGFTDQERRLCVPLHLAAEKQGAFDYACEHPAEEMPDWIINEKFPRGSKVSFKYSELSDTGIPLKARYWRKHVS